MQSSSQRFDRIAILSGAIATVSLVLAVAIGWLARWDAQASAVSLPLMFLFIAGTIVCTVLGLVALSQQEGIQKSSVVAIFGLMAINLAVLCLGIALLSGYRPPVDWFDIPKMQRNGHPHAEDGWA